MLDRQGVPEDGGKDSFRNVSISFQTLFTARSDLIVLHTFVNVDLRSEIFNTTETRGLKDFLY